MPKPRPSVVTTNPAASRLPQGLGTFASTPAPVEPIRPTMVPKSRQLVAGPSVKITNRKAAR